MCRVVAVLSLYCVVAFLFAVRSVVELLDVATDDVDLRTTFRRRVPATHHHCLEPNTNSDLNSVTSVKKSRLGEPLKYSYY